MRVKFLNETTNPVIWLELTTDRLRVRRSTTYPLSGITVKFNVEKIANTLFRQTKGQTQYLIRWKVVYTRHIHPTLYDIVIQQRVSLMHLQSGLYRLLYPHSLTKGLVVNLQKPNQNARWYVNGVCLCTMDINSMYNN